MSRELPPRQPGVVTVGAFHSGTKHNIISDQAHLQLTVRNTSEKTRDTLLNGIKRISENLGRAAGLPEDKLPEVVLDLFRRKYFFKDGVLLVTIGKRGAISWLIDFQNAGMSSESRTPGRTLVEYLPI